jgi:hypothetical protein
MRRRNALWLLFSLVAGGVISPMQSVGAQYLTGRQLIELCSDDSPGIQFCYGYLSGYTEAAKALSAGHLACMPDGVSAEQKRQALITSRLPPATPPETSAVVMVFWTLADAYKCPE